MTDTAPTAGWYEGREHLLPIRVYYEDTDFTGVVYHANYLRYLERARSDSLRLSGVGHAELLMRPDPLAFMVARMEIDFLRSARIDDALLVRTSYDAVKGARLIIAQSIERGGDTLCRALVHAACVGLDGRPKRLPKDLAGRLTPWLRGQGAP